MITIDDTFMNFSVGWIVEYKDGTVIYEGQKSWSEIPKINIKSLSLKWYDRLWSISGKENYLQFRRGFVVLNSASGGPTETTLAERCIGYYDERGRKVIYRINDQTGTMKLEVREG